MPWYYKYPAYIGNGLLLSISVILLFKGPIAAGFLIGALTCLNLFLVRKLDQFSREEVWLATQLRMTKMREQLLTEQARLADMERAAAGGTPPPSDAPRQTN